MFIKISFLVFLFHKKWWLLKKLQCLLRFLICVNICKCKCKKILKTVLTFSEGLCTASFRPTVAQFVPLMYFLQTNSNAKTFAFL